ncbi:MAG TPA: hypothetical protein VM616_01640 [Gammaproteobacteria bacterium]|nr:hypothetical protein [Gammaproteobacteria bacterium]
MVYRKMPAHGFGIDGVAGPLELGAVKGVIPGREGAVVARASLERGELADLRARFRHEPRVDVAEQRERPPGAARHFVLELPGRQALVTAKARNPVAQGHCLLDAEGIGFPAAIEERFLESAARGARGRVLEKLLGHRAEIDRHHVAAGSALESGEDIRRQAGGLGRRDLDGVSGLDERLLVGHLQRIQAVAQHGDLRAHRGLQMRPCAAACLAIQPGQLPVGLGGAVCGFRERKHRGISGYRHAEGSHFFVAAGRCAANRCAVGDACEQALGDQRVVEIGGHRLHGDQRRHRSLRILGRAGRGVDANPGSGDLVTAICADLRRHEPPGEAGTAREGIAGSRAHCREGRRGRGERDHRSRPYNPCVHEILRRSAMRDPPSAAAPTQRPYPVYSVYPAAKEYRWDDGNGRQPGLAHPGTWPRRRARPLDGGLVPPAP